MTKKGPDFFVQKITNCRSRKRLKEARANKAIHFLVCIPSFRLPPHTTSFPVTRSDKKSGTEQTRGKKLSRSIAGRTQKDDSLSVKELVVASLFEKRGGKRNKGKASALNSQ